MTTIESLVHKCHPSTIRCETARFHAMVCYILGQTDWVKPGFSALAITSDGFLLGEQTGDCGFNDFIGYADDLEKNWDGFMEAAGVTAEERALADQMYRNRIKDWRLISV